MECSLESYYKLLDELDDGSRDYSFFRKFVEASHPDPKVLVQMKCIEKFKWEISEKAGYEIGWNESCHIWAAEGYAKIFSEVYDAKNPCVQTTYAATMEKFRSLKLSYQVVQAIMQESNVVSSKIYSN